MDLRGAGRGPLNFPRYLADPYRHHHWLRANDPVHWSADQRAWVLTRHADILTALKHPALSSHRAPPVLDSLDPDTRAKSESFQNTIGSWLVRSDPPAHTRLRRLASKALDGSTNEQLRKSVEEGAHRLLDAVERSVRMDVITDFAAPLVFSAIADQIGVPREDHPRLQDWTFNVGRAAEGTPHPVLLASATQSLRASSDYFARQLRARRLQPRDDLLTHWLAAEYNGDRLHETEVSGLAMLLLLAGQDTATHFLANGVLALCQNPDQWEKLKAIPSLAGSAAEELLRYNTPLQGVLRIAMEELELSGRQIARGQTVMILLAAANRDPAQFSQPDRLDIGRENNRHSGFGHGAHYCLGASIARAIGSTALRVLLVERFPRLSLAHSKIPWQGNMLFRGQQSLPVLFNNRTPHLE